MPQSLDLTNLNGLNLDLCYLLRSLILIALLMPARFLLLARY